MRPDGPCSVRVLRRALALRLLWPRCRFPGLDRNRGDSRRDLRPVPVASPGTRVRVSCMRSQGPWLGVHPQNPGPASPAPPLRGSPRASPLLPHPDLCSPLFSPGLWVSTCVLAALRGPAGTCPLGKAIKNQGSHPGRFLPRGSAPRPAPPASAFCCSSVYRAVYVSRVLAAWEGVAAVGAGPRAEAVTMHGVPSPSGSVSMKSVLNQ